ncbi:DUF2255 family protein [Cryobacterium sp. PAMC25264]|uniref:DUF2255 family protein n=1 Tax=Cryobacterium sp. PAMC25264 TaxID=2861288 RepID=UPI001C63655E|nr:DUF2255 family protein [Cryobacterium sp. PAMC25264]QYF74378.1 DUF2255 family protein [Cryobacterium sp. PAMC25264]
MSIDVSTQQGNGDGLIDYLSHTDDLMIATTLKTGGEIGTEIWAVVVDGAGYIRNGFGQTSKWYRRVQRSHQAAFINGDRRYPVTIEDVDDEATINAVDAAYGKKYRGPGVSAVLSSGTRRYTMRVVPDAGPNQMP